MTAPHLFHFRVSHFNEKVRWALDYKRLPHYRTAVVPGFHVPKIRGLSGQNQVPVLEIGERTICDSTRIIRELEELHPDPPLYPAEREEREAALAIEDHFDEEIAPDLRRLFWWAYVNDSASCARMATDGFSDGTRRAFRAAFPVLKPVLRWNVGLRPSQIAEARRRLPAHIDWLEDRLGNHEFLVGNRFSIADLTATSVLTALLRPDGSTYPLPEPWPERLIELRQSVADRAGCRWALEIYRAYRGESAEMVAPGR